MTVTRTSVEWKVGVISQGKWMDITYFPVEIMIQK